MQKLDLMDKVFGRLTVIAEDGRSRSGKVKWMCRCSCRTDDPVELPVIGSKLVNGATRSCGCLQIEAARRTGNRFKHLLIPGDHGQRRRSAARNQSENVTRNLPVSISYVKRTAGSPQ